MPTRKDLFQNFKWSHPPRLVCGFMYVIDCICWKFKTIFEEFLKRNSGEPSLSIFIEHLHHKLLSTASSEKITKDYSLETLFEDYLI